MNLPVVRAIEMISTEMLRLDGSLHQRPSVAGNLMSNNKNFRVGFTTGFRIGSNKLPQRQSIAPSHTRSTTPRTTPPTLELAAAATTTHQLPTVTLPKLLPRREANDCRKSYKSRDLS